MSGGMEDTAHLDNALEGYLSGAVKFNKEMDEAIYKCSPKNPIDTVINSRTVSVVDEVKYMKQLVADHWRYIYDVLYHSGNKSEDELMEIKFHYTSAMAHGFRHGVEACEKGMVTWEGLLHQK